MLSPRDSDMVISIYKCNSRGKSELRKMRMLAKAGCAPNVFVLSISVWISEVLVRVRLINPHRRKRTNLDSAIPTLL